MCILKAGPSVGPNPVTGKGIKRLKAILLGLSVNMICIMLCKFLNREITTHGGRELFLFT